MAKNGLGLETELRLGLPGAGGEAGERKRVFSDISGKVAAAVGNKAAVVGWPPVRKSRYGGGGGVKMYVKVSVDGAPFLRKIDLSNHKSYSDLVMALEQLFGCFGLG